MKEHWVFPTALIRGGKKRIDARRNRVDKGHRTGQQKKSSVLICEREEKGMGVQGEVG